MDFRTARQEYRRQGLDIGDLDPDPVVQFERWLSEAVDDGIPEPTAMTLATADGGGRPSARTVLLKGLDARGFDFYTNLDSRKARDLRANPRAALVFRWPEHERQVIVTGQVGRVTDAEADGYFASRPRDSQIAAWASPQSRVIDGRAELEARVEEISRTYEERDVPRPPGWGGFRVSPSEIEFWQGRAARLHDRIRYRLEPEPAAGDRREWVRERLAP